MVRKGAWKFHYYVRHRPELFNLDRDPEELHDLAGDAEFAEVVRQIEAILRGICNPEEIDALAKADQRAMIEQLGGIETASRMSAGGATPVPKEALEQQDKAIA